MNSKRILSMVLTVVLLFSNVLAAPISSVVDMPTWWSQKAMEEAVLNDVLKAENNLVRPYIFGKFLDLHPLIIYLFLFITAQYLGVVGVIFAPAIAATVCVLIQELYIKNIN